MLPESPPARTALPESLRLQLAAFRRHLWRIKVLEAVAAGWIGLLLSFLLVYGLDRVLPTPGWVRLVVLLGGMSLFAGFAPYWLHRWVWRQRREEQIARLIARRFPGLGDRLLGVIELQDQSGSPDSLSPRLREAAMAAVAAESSRRSLDEALPPQWHRRWVLVAILLGGVAAVAFTLTPRAGLNALQRWLMPLAPTERYTFTRLDRAPQRLAVPLGESFEVELRLAADSEQRPASAEGRYGLQPSVSATLDGASYRFRFPGQQEPGGIVFKVGDLRHELRVEPVLRPSTEQVRAVVTLPAYLGGEERSVDLKTGVLSVVEGGTVRVELDLDRALARGRYGPTRALEPTEGEPSGSAPPPLEGDLAISGDRASTPALAVGATPFEIPFSWTDTIGLDGESGFRIRVEALKDAAPTCYIQGVDRQKAILPEETVDFEVLAEDDLGVEVTGLEWSGQFTRPTDEAPANGELDLGRGAPGETRVARAASFSPAAFGIAPQKITLRAFTEDRFPGRGRVHSEPVVLYVLTRDEHAQMLKGQFDRQITELEDLARRELGLLEENERIERLDGKELQNPETRARIEGQEVEEQETERRSADLTRRLEDLMKDAARNGDIDKEALRKMAEALKALQELSAEDVPQVRGKLDESVDPSNTPDKAAKDIDEAVERQREVVEKMREAIDQANDANRRLEAGTFVNRLKKAATEQDGIVASLKTAFEKMLGIERPVLDPSEIRRLDDNARQQSVTASDVRWIQEDLVHYHARTGNATFKAVLDEMRDSKVDTGLEDVCTNLGSNHSYRAAAAAAAWAARLKAWAGKLESENQGDEDAAGGGEGGGPSEDEDFEFMLRVMRMIQQEQDLRGRTRTLEQLRRDAGGAAAQPVESP